MHHLCYKKNHASIRTRTHVHDGFAVFEEMRCFNFNVGDIGNVIYNREQTPVGHEKNR